MSNNIYLIISIVCLSLCSCNFISTSTLRGEKDSTVITSRDKESPSQEGDTTTTPKTDTHHEKTSRGNIPWVFIVVVFLFKKYSYVPRRRQERPG